MVNEEKYGVRIRWRNKLKTKRGGDEYLPERVKCNREQESYEARGMCREINGE